MITALHKPIMRDKKYEQPVTITLDDGSVIDHVLYFDAEPQSKDIDIAVAVVIDRHANKNEDPPEEFVSVKDVEIVLKQKKIMTDLEKWNDWKSKSIATAKEII